MIHLILKCFAQASGLKVNANKSSALPIRCGSINLDTILAPLGIPCKSFPVTYLGMPLSLRNLTKADLDPFLVKFGNKTAAWKGGLMAKSGRLVLIKSGLTALAIYMMTIHKLPAWVLKKIVQLCRAWLWTGEDTCSGGKCRVGWS